MKEIEASLKYLKGSCYKLNVVADLIRNMNVIDADSQLYFCEKRVSVLVRKLLKSAVANAENNFNMDSSNLYVSACYATPGPTLKRIRPVSKGRAYRILKRTLKLI